MATAYYYSTHRDHCFCSSGLNLLLTRFCAPHLSPSTAPAAAAVPSGTRVVLPQRAARAAAQRRGRAVVDESSESDNEQGDSSGSDWEAERECETWSDEEDDVEEEEEEEPGAAAGGAKRQKRRSASGAQFQDLKAAAWLGGGVQLAACASLQPPEANVTSVTVAAIRSPTAAACQDTAAAAADLEAAAAGSTQGDSQQSLLAEVLEWMDDEEVRRTCLMSLLTAQGCSLAPPSC